LTFFGFKDIKGWPGNPDVYGWVWENGFRQKRDEINEPLTCEDTTIMLGREGAYRWECKDLRMFLYYPPDLGELEPNTSIEL